MQEMLQRTFSENLSAGTGVLVIDDDEDALEEIAALLKSDGMDVATANTAEQAFERLKERENIAIVLCDLRLGNVSGLHLVQSIRRDANRQLRFVAITGFPDMDVAVTCFRNGFSDFIRKPIEAWELLNSVRGLHKSVKDDSDRSALIDPEIDIIQEIQKNIKSVSEKINALATVSTARKAPSGFGFSGAPAIPITAKMLQGILKARSSRNLYFSAELFSDPAWDMLLDLFLAKMKDEKIVVSSLCVGSGVPISTAHRRLNVLEKKGLILRTRDQKDTRRVFVELTLEGERKMRLYLEEALKRNIILT